MRVIEVPFEDWEDFIYEREVLQHQMNGIWDKQAIIMLNDEEGVLVNQEPRGITYSLVDKKIIDYWRIRNEFK